MHLISSYTEKLCLFSIHASGMLIQPAKIWKKMCHLYKVMQTQICCVYMFTCHLVVL
jgi:hypothetical protein